MAVTVHERSFLPLLDARIAARSRVRALWWPHLALVPILVLSGILEFAGLMSEGYANTYYAAAVKSMLTSWHNFFYASFDAGGFVSVDKSPLGLWVQAASAKLLGFSGLSLLLPEALAGVASVALLYHLVSRAYGPVAGLVAALALAVTPISAVTERNNTSDSLLILVLLFGVYAVSRAADTGRLRLLLLSALLIGLGFNIKMMQAYLVVPAFGLAYYLGAPLRRRVRVAHLLTAALVVLAVSLAWLIAVDLTPAADRPYVSDSGTNSALSLALGYNGLGRVTQALFSGLSSVHLFGISIDLTLVPAFAADIGNPSLLRLVSPVLAEQVSWLLPLALIGLIGALIELPKHLPLDRRGKALVIWGGWLAGAGAFFSTGRFYHLYYLVMLSPAIAALAGIGVVSLWRLYVRAGSSAGWPARAQGLLLPAALLATAYVQVQILQAYSDWGSWLLPIAVAVPMTASLVLIAGLLRIQVRLAEEIVVGAGKRVAAGALVLAAVALLLSPGVWSAKSVAAGNGSAWLPQAGPSQGAGGGFGGGAGGGPRGGSGNRPNGFGAGAAPTNGQSGSQGSQPGGRMQTGSSLPGGAGSRGERMGFGSQGVGGAGGGILTFSGSNAQTLDSKLISYLLANQQGAKFLVATTTSSYASLFILQTNQTAMALGGYQGWDRIVTPSQLAKLVANNTVRYFYISAGQSTGTSAASGGRSSSTTAAADNLLGPGAATTVGSGTDQTTDLTQWVRAHCSAVSSSLWSSSSSGNGQMQLYNCASLVKAR